MLSLYDIVHLQQGESIDIESNLRLYNYNGSKDNIVFILHK